jgi:hypothetical protein
MQEDCRFETSVGYIARPLKRKKEIACARVLLE